MECAYYFKSECHWASALGFLTAITRVRGLTPPGSPLLSVTSELAFQRVQHEIVSEWGGRLRRAF